MSRLYTIGYEMNDTNYETGVTYYGTPSITSSEKRTGTYALSLYNATIGYGVGKPSEVYIGVGMFLNNVSVVQKVVAFWTSNALLFQIKIAIGGSIQACRGSTVVAESTNTLATGGWNYVELYYKEGDSAGVITIRVNGAEWLTFTGDTKNVTGDFSTVRLSQSSSFSFIIYYDDLVINDTAGSVNNSWPGQQKLYLATVNAAGDATDLTASAGTNYEAVDEIPPSTTDYVYGSTATEKDLYNITDPLAGTETLGSVVVNFVAKLDSGSGNLAATVKAGLTEDDATADGLTETWVLYQSIWATNPDDSAAWAPADIDDLQIGIEIRA